MADTSQRKARITVGSGTTLIEKNKEGASIPQGNEIAQNVYNIIRSEQIDFDNAENFNQTESSYFSTANQTYNEAEKVLQALEKKKAMLSYAVTFNANQYTFNARETTVSELIENSIEQDVQDKTVYLSPVEIENGFITQFVAPATNTGSSTIRIQKYDGTYHTTLTLKKYDGISLVNLIASDITQNQLYNVVIIGGNAIIFGSQSSLNLSVQTIGNQTITQWKNASGTVVRQEIIGVETTTIGIGGSRTITFAIPFPGATLVQPQINTGSPDNGLLLPQITSSNSSQFVIRNYDPDSGWTAYKWIAFSQG